MSDSNTPVEAVIDDDLDAFSADFFGQKEAVDSPASETEDKTPEAVDDALEPNDTPVEDDADGTEQDKSEEEEEVEQTPTEPKLTPTQKRINEVVGKQRAAERALEAETAARKALEARIAELTSKDVQATPAKVEVDSTRPDPLAKNEDGTDKYHLGDFDPEYIADLVKYNNAKDRAEYEAEQSQRREQAAREAEQEALRSSWVEKLGPAKERYPDFDEVGNQLVTNFEDLDQHYGEYLSATIMSMDHGPDVLYYLAQNPVEAKAIVNAGPTKATLALGRLEAQFAAKTPEKVEHQPRVSQAPTPPPQNKGNLAAVTEVPDDTDDLEAFTAKLFKKRK